MWSLHLIPSGTKVPFMSARRWLFGASFVLVVASFALVFGKGLNFGIDFVGGILMEVGFKEQPADLAAMRSQLGALGLGNLSLQEFGKASDVLIRFERQPGGETAQNAAVGKIRETLSATYGEQIEYRRVELVGPKVGGELVRDGIIAVVVSIVLMLIYVWFRFELPFGIGSVIALIHDVILTLGVYALSGFDFDLSTVAAVLLIIGFSMNDTVVVYDRVRENLRKYKALGLQTLIDRSMNETLSRTIITSGTVVIALLALLIFGGEVIRGFSFAMLCGVIVGTYSSIFIASASLLHIRPKRAGGEVGAAKQDGKPGAAIETAPESSGAAVIAASPGGDQQLPSPPQGDGGGKRRASSSRARRRRRGR
jgi:preprotein translocase SecF subunit